MTDKTITFEYPNIESLLEIPLRQDAIFPGNILFELYATHGLPLDVSLGEIMVKNRIVIDWVGFIEQARKNGRWDYQILEMMEVGLQDADVSRNWAAGILDRARLYVLQHPHPKLRKP